MLQGPMGPHVVIVFQVRSEGPTQLPFMEDDQAVQVLSTNRTDQPLYVRGLPRAAVGNELLPDPHPFDPSIEGCPVDRISVAEEVLGGRLLRERVDDLLRGHAAVGASVMWK